MVVIHHDPGRCLHTFDEMIAFDRRILLWLPGREKRQQ